MDKKVIVIGAGGHARAAVALLEHNEYAIQGIYDDSYDVEHKETIMGHALVGSTFDVPNNAAVFLAVGNNHYRKELLVKLGDQIVKENIIHPSAVIEKSAQLGQFNQVLARVYINAMATVGNNNLLNSGCIVEHECKVGHHNHISVGSVLTGRVTVGDQCFIGANAVVKNGVNICNNVIVGAGAVVINDITEPGTYVGNPVRKVK